MVDVVDLVEEVVALDHNQCVRLPPGPAGVLENLLLNNFSDKFLRKKTLAHIFFASVFAHGDDYDDDNDDDDDDNDDDRPI